MSLRRARTRLLLLSTLLLAEIAVLTPFVEFTRPPMALLASPITCSSVFVSLLAFWIMAGERLATLATSDALPDDSGFWAVIHVVLYSSLFVYSRQLDAAASPKLFEGLRWVALAVAAGGSGWLIFFSVRATAITVRRNLPSLAAAVAIGAVNGSLTPAVRQTWPHVCGPIVRITEMLLVWFPGNAVCEMHDGRPIVGTGGVRLVVTPHCSELESLLAFFILAATMVVSRRREIHSVACAIVLVLAGFVFYLSNAVRLYLLTLCGWMFGAGVAVDLAHSRLSGVFYLAATAAVLAGSYWLCRRRSGEE